MKTETPMSIHRLPQFVNQVRAITLAENGATFDVRTGSQLFVTTGYGIARYPKRSKVCDGSVDVAELLLFVILNLDLLGQSNHYLGTWLDGKTGKLHIDVTVWEKDYDTAMQMARDHQQ